MQTRRVPLLVVLVLGMVMVVQACDQTGTTPEPDTFTLTVTLEGLGVGTVTNDETGIACDTTGATCSADVPEGTSLTLTATPADGSEFVGWGTDGTANPLTVTITGDKNVTAEFDNPDLALETVGAAGGTVMSRDSAITLVIPDGALSEDQDITIEIVDPADLGAEWNDFQDDIGAAYQMGPDGLQFDVPAEVRLTPQTSTLTDDSVSAVLPGLWTLDGDTVATVDSIEVATDASTSASNTTAYVHHFSPLVKPEDGIGIHWSGIQETADIGETFRLEFTASPSSHESIMNGATHTAILDDGLEDGATGFGLTGGVLHFYLELTCVELGSQNATIAVKFTTEAGSHRVAIMNFTTTCTGHTLTVTTSGEGTGIVKGDNAAGDDQGITCGTEAIDCSDPYAPGQEVTLVAEPGDGSVFAGWAVDGEVAAGNGDNSITITMDGDHTVDAAFDPAPTAADLTVDLSGDGDGTVTSDPAGIDCTKSGDNITGECTATFDFGTNVTLTATDPNGSTITDWSGDEGSLNARGQWIVALTGALVLSLVFPNVPNVVTVFQLAALSVLSFESMSLATVGFPFAEPAPDLAMDVLGEACPTVMVAGDGAVLAIDACTGDLVQQYDFGFTFYDAWALPLPEGETGDNLIFASGQDFAYFWIDAAGAVTGQIGQVYWGTAHDATPIGGDPTNGLVVARENGSASTLAVVRYDPTLGYHHILDAFFDTATTPPNMQSAYAAGVPADPVGLPEEAIAVGTDGGTGVLWYMESTSGPEPTGTYVDDLAGNNPRRIRCDLDSGICAVSDFANSLVTTVLWSGTGMPSVADSTTAGQIASGPVGLDVFGHYIVTAGYNDNQYSIIEVDAAGAIVNVTTQALPAECTQPGHAVFLRDGANTVLVSCNGSQAIVRIPNAF